MKGKQLLTIIIAVLGVVTVKAQSFGNESLDYSIYYKCWFIDGVAAHANVQCNCENGNYCAILGGYTRPIGGIIYSIADTLQASYSPYAQAANLAKENVTYQSGYYRKPHEGQYSDPDSPKNYRNIDGGGYLSADNATMECVCLTSDMLCMFYYAKTADFSELPVGVSKEVPIAMPDGSERLLQITYQGETENRGRQVYDLRLNFTYGEGFSQYPITCYIDKELRIPSEFKAEIAIGDVEMVYNY